MEDGETEEEAIVREFSEEFGVTVKVGDFIAEKTFVHSGTPFSLRAYRIEVPHTGEAQKYALSEHTGYAWTKLDSIRGLNFVDSDKLLYPEIVSYAKKNGLFEI